MLNHMIGRIFGRAVGCPCQEELFDFALDGMDAAQQERVRKHLGDCPSCCDQVKDYAWVSEGIALTAPQMDPPVNICDKVKARIRAEGEAQAQRPAPVMSLGRDPLAGWPRFWMRLGPIFALSSVMMTALAFFAAFMRPIPMAPAGASEAGLVSSLLNSPTMMLVTLNGEGDSKGSAASLFASPGMGQALVKIKGLKASAPGLTYALWSCEKGGKPCRLGSFQAVDGRCTYVLSLSKPLASASAPMDFEVTLENAANPPAAEKGPTRLRGHYNL
jgi:hypothetical protein